MGKRGRPAAPLPTEQVTVRLPRFMLEQFRKGRGVSKEIQERLVGSLDFDHAEPNFRDFVFKIERLALDIERAMGAPWYADIKAHDVFLETLQLVLADLPKPTAQVSEIKADAGTAAQLIYNRYVSTVRDLQSGVKLRMQAPVSALLGHVKPKGKKP